MLFASVQLGLLMFSYPFSTPDADFCWATSEPSAAVSHKLSSSEFLVDGIRGRLLHTVFVCITLTSKVRSNAGPAYLTVWRADLTIHISLLPTR